MADTLVAIGVPRSEVSCNTLRAQTLPDCLVRNAKLIRGRA
jgi:hypothetical protein